MGSSLWASLLRVCGAGLRLFTTTATATLLLVVFTGLSSCGVDRHDRRALEGSSSQTRANAASQNPTREFSYSSHFFSDKNQSNVCGCIIPQFFHSHWNLSPSAQSSRRAG